MKKLMLFLTLTALVMLTNAGCDGKDNVVNGNQTEFNVTYEVRFLSQGAVKISHKDPNGNEITNDPVTSDWSSEYNFGERVDAFLDVEASEVAPSEQVGVQLTIFVNGNRGQQATSTITLDKKSTLSLTRP